jgi:hypothetical protein
MWMDVGPPLQPSYIGNSTHSFTLNGTQVVFTHIHWKFDENGGGLVGALGANYPKETPKAINPIG